MWNKTNDTQSLQLGNRYSNSHDANRVKLKIQLILEVVSTALEEQIIPDVKVKSTCKEALVSMRPPHHRMQRENTDDRHSPPCFLNLELHNMMLVRAWPCILCQVSRRQQAKHGSVFSVL